MLAAVAKCGNIARSCRAAKIGRQTHYNWIAEDPEYAAAFQDAKDDFADSLEAEIHRRAVTGTLKPVYQNGKEVGKIREYSDTLLIFLTKGERPEKYKDRSEVNARLDLSRLSDEQLEAISRGQGGSRT